MLGRLRKSQKTIYQIRLTKQSYYKFPLKALSKLLCISADCEVLLFWVIRYILFLGELYITITLPNKHFIKPSIQRSTAIHQKVLP
jgi:hypothetical protein